LTSRIRVDVTGGTDVVYLRHINIHNTREKKQKTKKKMHWPWVIVKALLDDLEKPEVGIVIINHTGCKKAATWDDIAKRLREFSRDPRNKLPEFVVDGIKATTKWKAIMSLAKVEYYFLHQIAILRRVLIFFFRLVCVCVCVCVCV
jgi:hypothetical protein